MKIKKVCIQAFRAYNDIQDGTFDFSLSNGEPAKFVAIYAPNGFGKSSFYDAVEWALTKNIGRYVRSSSKSSNTAAANNDKTPDKAQYIIRNHDAPANLDTLVKIYTTNGKPISRRASPAALGKRDFAFSSNVAKGTQSFRDIFLSQEGVDTFIRESKPTDRYERFTDSFCTDAENTRKKLQALRFENAQILEEIEAECSKLQNLLDQPIDLTAFQNYNTAVESLGEDGHPLRVSEESFDYGTEGNYSFVIAEKTQQFEAILQDKISALNRLNELLNNLESAKRSEENLLQSLENFNNLKHAADSFITYRNYDSQAINHRAELAALSAQLSLINRLRDALPTHSKIKHEASLIQKTISEKKQLIKNEETTQSNLIVTLAELANKIITTEATLNQWQRYKEAASLSFIEIQSSTNITQNLEAEISNIEPRIQALISNKEGLTERLNKLCNLIINRHNSISALMGYIALDEDQTLRLTAANRRISQADADLSENLTALNLVNEQSGLFGQLVNLGKSLIDEHKGPNCPLCDHKFDSHEELLNKISNNQAISSLQRHLQQKALAISNTRNIDLSEANEVVRSLQKALDESISSIRTNITKATEQIDSSTSILNTFRNQMTQATAKIESARAHTLQMDELALSAHISSQTNIAELNKQNLISTQAARLSNLNESTYSCTQHQDKIRELNASLDILKAEPAHDAITAYLIAAELDLETNLTDHFARQTSELEEQIKYRNDMLNQVVADSTAMQISMKEAGTWLNNVDIEQRYNALKADRDSWLNINSEYIQQITDTLKITKPTSLDGIEEILAARISKYTSEISSSQTKKHTILALQAIFPTLLPYIQHLDLKKSLTKLQLRETQHTSIHTHLENEITKVISYLKAKISGFFYEDLINDIYKKIDPHPNFKTVEFVPFFSQDGPPSLHILVIGEDGKRLPPTLYFSAAQLNILSLSIFLAKAIHASHKGSPLDVILIDDPMHSMDSINILSTIDLLRNITQQLNKQIIISTHDENFYRLLQQKIHPEYGSKFLRLESYGIVRTNT